MMYKDNEYKWIVVINRKIALPQLLNATAHLALGIRTQCLEEAAGVFHNYEGSDGRTMASISHWPVIVLQAKNGNQLRTLRAEALAAGLPCQAFLDTMIGFSAAEQMQKTNSTTEEDVEYFAVCLFGKSDELKGLTKKFSLFVESRGESQPQAAAPSGGESLGPEGVTKNVSPSHAVGGF